MDKNLTDNYVKQVELAGVKGDVKLLVSSTDEIKRVLVELDRKFDAVPRNRRASDLTGH